MSYFPLDLRLAVRSLAKSKGTVLVVCVSIALAVAGNAAIFSIIEASILRPIPYPDASRLAFLWQSDRRIPDNDSPVAPGTLLDWRERCRSFSAIEAFRPATFALTGGDHPEEIHAMEVTPPHRSVALVQRSFVLVHRSVAPVQWGIPPGDLDLDNGQARSVR